LRWPGHIKPGRYDALINSIDLVPTILAAAGLKPAPQMPGLNLLDVVAAGGKTPRTTIFGEIFEHDVADIDRPAASLLYRWAIQGKWKLIVPKAEAQPVELYDLTADPFETKNLAAENPGVVADLRKQIDDWWPGE
jgi:uncharacterized sulfatase